MAGIGLVDARADDGADVERSHMFSDVLRGPVFFRQSDVEVGLGGMGLKGARWIH